MGSRLSFGGGQVVTESAAYHVGNNSLFGPAIDFQGFFGRWGHSQGHSSLFSCEVQKRAWNIAQDRYLLARP